MDRDEALLSSMLLETELRRLAVHADLVQAAVTDLLQRFDTSPLPCASVPTSW